MGQKGSRINDREAGESGRSLSGAFSVILDILHTCNQWPLQQFGICSCWNQTGAAVHPRSPPWCWPPKASVVHVLRLVARQACDNQRPMNGGSMALKL